MAEIRSTQRKPAGRAAIAVLVLVIAMNVLAGPTGADIDITDPGVVEQGLAASDTLWPSPTIPVCWESSAAPYSAEQAWVEDAVTSSWEEVSNVNFTGWDACSTGEAGVRIAAADIRPATQGLGTQLDGRVDGVKLNFDLVAEPILNCSSTEVRREFCIRAIAVHEFGHVLGFAHEHLRDDGDPACMEEQIGTDPVWLLTEYDPESVMNYCSTLWNNDGQLTELDVAGVRLAYGPWTGGIEVPIHIEGSITARDNDWPFPDLVGTLDVEQTLMVASDNSSENVTKELCVGDELRIEVEFQPMVLGGSSIVMVIGTRMYEGPSCDNDDLDDSGLGLLVLGVASGSYSDELVNNELFGGDTATVRLGFTREFDPAAAAANCEDCANMAENARFATRPPTVGSARAIQLCSPVTCQQAITIPPPTPTDKGEPTPQPRTTPSLQPTTTKPGR